MRGVAVVVHAAAERSGRVGAAAAGDELGAAGVLVYEARGVVHEA